MEWNGGMDWTGTVEWNGMECGKQLSINAHAHMVPYAISLKFLVWGCCKLSLGYCRGGDELRGLEHSFAQGTS